MWIWKTEIIETPIEDQLEFTRRVTLAVKNILSLKKSFTIDNVLRELWECNINLGDLKVENKRKMITKVTTDFIGDNENYTMKLDNLTKEYSWTYHPPIEPEIPRRMATINFLSKNNSFSSKSKSIKKRMGLKGKLK